MIVITEKRDPTVHELLDVLVEKIEDLRLRGYDMRKARDYLQALRQETSDPIWQPDTDRGNEF